MVAQHPGVSHCKYPSHLPCLALKTLTLELEHPGERQRTGAGGVRVTSKEEFQRRWSRQATFNCAQRSLPPAAFLGTAQTTQWIHFLDYLELVPWACGWAWVHMSAPTISLPSRHGTPSSPSCLPMFVGHRDDTETCGRWTSPQFVIHCSPSPPSYHPTKRGNQWVTHRCLALSPLSTCGKTPLKIGQNSRHRAGSRRRCCSTNLGSRANCEQLYPRAPRVTQARTASALPLIPTPSQAAQRVEQTLMSLSLWCSLTQVTDDPQFSALLHSPLIQERI